MADNQPPQTDRDGDTFFGPWLRRRRRELDLTQNQLAHQVGCVADTVRKLEAGMRRPSRAMAERLALRLIIPVEEQAAFLVAARAGCAPPDCTLAPIPTPLLINMPVALSRMNRLPAPMTSFIGRDWEVATIGTRLRMPDVRLVTLTGAGGVGKTRLALQIAGGLHDAFPNGVLFVNLAPISDPTLILPMIAHTLGVREQYGTPIVETLRTVLREKQLLVLLDNFEHLLVAAPEVAALLAELPKVKLLVTSREALHLYGEHIVVVAPLAIPEPTAIRSAEQLTQYAAVQLFVARAQAASEQFRLTDANAPAVAAICARLDGLPLAIELAAAQVPLFPPTTLLPRLEQRLPMLKRGPRDLPARQQTLHNTIEWSYELLDTREQALFCRLAVFVGGWTLDAAAVCLVDNDLALDVLDGLQSLIEQSLVQHIEVTDGTWRFTMLETIHEYALEQLVQRGEVDALRHQHAIYYQKLVSKLMGWWTERGEVLHLAVEVGNLRAALGWAIAQQNAEIAQSISYALLPLAADYRETLSWLEMTLELPVEASSATRAVRALLLNRAGWSAAGLGDYDRAQAYFLTGLRLQLELDDSVGQTLAQRSLAWMAMEHGNFVEAQSWLEQSLNLCRQAQEQDGIAWSLDDLGRLAFFQANLEHAEQLHTESLMLMRSRGRKDGIVRACLGLGLVARAQGQRERAVGWYQEGIAQAIYTWAPWGIQTLEGLAAVRGEQGDGVQAARLFGAAEAQRELRNARLFVSERAAYERDVAAVRAQLGEGAFASAWGAGRAMTLEQAVAYALAEDN